MKKTISALLAGFITMGAAQAQTASNNTPHAYIGVGIGAVKDTIGDEHRANAKLFGGYEFDQNWGVEAGYTQFRNSDFYTGSGDSFSKATMKSFGLYAAAKYTIPVNEQFSAYGKLGISHSERQVEGMPAGWSASGRDTGLYGGLGLQYKLTSNVALVGEYERFGKRKGLGPKADVWTAGVKYSF